MGEEKSNDSHPQHVSLWSQGISKCGDRGIDPLKSRSLEQLQLVRSVGRQLSKSR